MENMLFFPILFLLQYVVRIQFIDYIEGYTESVKYTIFCKTIADVNFLNYAACLKLHAKLHKRNVYK